MSLAVTIGVVALISILAVATLSLAGRMERGSRLANRDAQLDAAAASGLAAAIDEWSNRNLGNLAIGASAGFPVILPNIPVSVTTTVTRVSAEFFWVVSEVIGIGEARRSENLIVRFRVPGARGLLEEARSAVDSLGFVATDSLVVAATMRLPGGSTFSPSNGVVHVAGDATLLAGSGRGVLVVDGRLAIVGPVSFSGVIIVRGGVVIASPNVTVSGLVRAAGDIPIDGPLLFEPSEVIVQDVLSHALTPSIIAGRRWAEMF